MGDAVTSGLVYSELRSLGLSPRWDTYSHGTSLHPVALMLVVSDPAVDSKLLQITSCHRTQAAGLLGSYADFYDNHSKTSF